MERNSVDISPIKVISHMYSPKSRGKWQWRHLIRGTFWKFENQKRFLFITGTVGHFRPNWWILSRYPVPLKNRCDWPTDENVDVIDCTEKFEHLRPRKVTVKGKSHTWKRCCDWSTDLHKCFWLVDRSDGGASPELPARGPAGTPCWPALLRAPGAGTLPQSAGMVRPRWPLLRLV